MASSFFHSRFLRFRQFVDNARITIATVNRINPSALPSVPVIRIAKLAAMRLPSWWS